jgi:hypothetical protein
VYHIRTVLPQIVALGEKLPAQRLDGDGNRHAGVRAGPFLGEPLATLVCVIKSASSTALLERNGAADAPMSYCLAFKDIGQINRNRPATKKAIAESVMCVCSPGPKCLQMTPMIISSPANWTTSGAPT